MDENEADITGESTHTNSQLNDGKNNPLKQSEREQTIISPLIKENYVEKKIYFSQKNQDTNDTQVHANTETNLQQICEKPKKFDLLNYFVNTKIPNKNNNYSKSINFIKKSDCYNGQFSERKKETKLRNNKINNKEHNNVIIYAPLILIRTFRTGNFIEAIYQNIYDYTFISFYYYVIKVDNPHKYFEMRKFYIPLKKNPCGF